MKERDRRPEAGSENALNIIGKGTVITGNITAAGDMRVEGRITGTVICKAKLVLSPDGVIEGNIDTQQATIAGEVKGTVIARQLLQIMESGKVLGDIVTEKLIVQLGAYFTGNCRMGKVETRTDAGNQLSEVKKTPFTHNPVVENQPQTQVSDGKEA
jgi:cytoskeletal protein CcmA (bactofilin family)